MIAVLSEMKNRLPLMDKILKASLVIFFESPTMDSDSWQVLSDQFKNIVYRLRFEEWQAGLKKKFFKNYYGGS